MRKSLIFIIFIVCSVILYGQTTTVTNNNTITIQGNVYYFQPSTTPSSPPPTQSSDFLGSGSWYGEQAARAWSSIADWVIDHHVRSTPAIIGNRDQIVFISAVHVIRPTDSVYNNLSLSGAFGFYNDRQVRIDYWVVRNGSPMADGRRETRWFGF